MKVAIILVNYNGEKDTIACLESLQDISIPQETTVSIYVVDNASREKFEIRNSKFEKMDITIIRSEENLGFAGGNNQGIRQALGEGADYVLLLNNDTIVDKDFLKELLVEAQRNEQAIFCPKIYFAKGFEFHEDRYQKDELGRVLWYAGGIMDWNNVLGHHRGVDDVDIGQFNLASETEIATGCCVFIPKTVFEKIGFFDEKYFLYYEDADLSIRAKKNGFKIYFVPDSIIWHKNAGSTGGSGSSLQDYFISRNRLLFGMKYAPFRSKQALVKESLGLLTTGRRWQKKGVLDFYLKKFGKGSYK